MIRHTPFRKINMIAGGEFHLLQDKMSRRRQPSSPRTLARAQLRQNRTVSLLAAGLMVLGAVFLCVTGAEALYAEPMAAGEGPSTTPRRSGLVRCPRRRRPSGPHLAFAPSAPDQRSAFDGDRSLRSPFVLWTGIWKRFHMFHYGRSGTGALLLCFNVAKSRRPRAWSSDRPARPDSVPRCI
jgi:hypothetical protein